MTPLLVILLLAVATLIALAYPLVRGAAPGEWESPLETSDGLDSLTEEAVQQSYPVTTRPDKPTSKAGACPSCGTPMGPDDRFCRHCGYSLELRCPECSTPYEAGDRFCVKCGTRLTGGQNA